MNWRNSLAAATLGLAILITPPTQRAIAALAPAATQPSPAIDTQKIHDLIAQLGNDSYPIRSAADSALRNMGPSILPALESENHALDPEAQLRIDNIIQSLWHRAGKIMPSQDWLDKCPKLSRDFSKHDPTQTVNIHEDADGIAVTYSTEQDGNLVERHAAGINPKALRQADPNAFAAYWSVRGQTDQRSPAIVGAIKSQSVAVDKVVGKPITDPDAVMRRELDNPDLSADQRQAIQKAIGDAAANRKHDGSANIE